MRRFATTLSAVLAIGALAATPAALAGESAPKIPLQMAPGSPADELLCATIQRLVEALGQVLDNVPRYAPPEIDPDGNIILRRLNPPAPAPLRREPPTWDFDQAAT